MIAASVNFATKGCLRPYVVVYQLPQTQQEMLKQALRVDLMQASAQCRSGQQIAACHATIVKRLANAFDRIVFLIPGPHVRYTCATCIAPN
ncbi:MAG: hypothetical protein AAFO17_17545 [Pseudomonadota bacterium]